MNAFLYQYAASYERGAAAVSGNPHRKRQHWGVHTNGTTVCAAQIGIKFHQSSGTAPL